MIQLEHITQFLNSSSSFYVVVIGMDSNFVYVSPNYDRNFRLDGETLRGKHFSTTLHPDDVAICEQIGERCFGAPGQMFATTLRKRNGQGGYVFTQWEMQALFDDTGAPEGMFCIGYNNTEVIHTRTQLDDTRSQLNAIGFMQSHLVRKPLANIIALTELIPMMQGEKELPAICSMLHKSAIELDDVIKYISTKTS